MKKRRRKRSPRKVSPQKRLLGRVPHSMLAMSVMTVGLLLAMASLAGAAPNKSINADTLDGLNSTDFLGVSDTAADSELLDGLDSTNLLPDGELAPGTTLRGRYDIYGQPADPNNLLVGADGISYVYTFGSMPEGHIIRLGTTEKPPAACPGGPGSPEAAPGHLCVYEQNRENIAPVWPLFYVQDPYGFGIRAAAASPGHAWSYGTWAVTAPEAAQPASLEP